MFNWLKTAASNVGNTAKNAVQSLSNFLNPKPAQTYNLPQQSSPAVQQAIQRSQGYTTPTEGQSSMLTGPGLPVAGSQSQTLGKTYSNATQTNPYPRGTPQIQGASTTIPASFPQGSQNYYPQNNGNGGTYDTSNPVVQNTTNDLLSKAFQDVYSTYLSNAGTNNTPFSFDEALAKSAAVQQYAPYYAQQLALFLKGYNNRYGYAQGQAGIAKQALESGSQLYKSQQARSLQDALQQTQGNYSQAGLGDSGLRQRSEGLLNVENQQSLQDFLNQQTREQQGVGLTLQNTLADLGVQKEQQLRDLATQQATSEQQAVSDSYRQAQAKAAAGNLAQTGPAPGEDMASYLQRRADIYKQFTVG